MASSNQTALSEETDLPVVFVMRLSFTGGVVTQPRLLPLHDVDGVQMLKLAEREMWIRALLFKSSVRTDVGDAVLRGLIAKVWKLVADASTSTATTSNHALPTKCNRAPNPLFSDEESSADEGNPAACPGTSTIGRQRVPIGVHRCTWGEVQFRAMVRHQVVYVEALAELCDLFVREARSLAASEGVADVYGARKRTAGEEDGTRGRVNWMRPSQSWRVTYINERGVRTSKMKELHVPSVSAFGEKLSDEEFEISRAQALKRAKELWDELDRSGAPRFHELERDQVLRRACAE